MIDLIANGTDATPRICITLSQDGEDVDINFNGELIAFFVVQDGKIQLERCEHLEEVDELAQKIRLNEIGQIVAP